MLDVDGKTVVSRTTEYEADKLKDKGVAFGGTVEGAKIEADLSMSAGSPTPLPKFSGGFFSFFWIDSPIQTEGVYYNWVKSLWSEGPASVTYIKFGSTQKSGRITLKSNPSNLIDIPMFQIENPFGDPKFSMDVKPEEPSPVLPSLSLTPPNSMNVDAGIEVDSGKK
jgi:hypothetical protein